MIICFNEKINNFNEKSLKKYKDYKNQELYIKSLMPTIDDVPDKKCPYCKTKYSLIKYGHYHRNISVFLDHNIVNFYVPVQRVKCKGCNKTHALLPNFIVPYIIMVCFSISKIVSEAISTSAYNLFKTCNISFQLIYKYIAIVLAFFTDFKILNNNKQYVPVQKFNANYFINNCYELSNSKYQLDFFKFHNWILFMQKFRNNSSPPVGIFITKSPPT